MVAARTKLVPIKTLLEGDCFFYYTDSQRTEREREIAEIDEWRVISDMAPLTAAQHYEYYAAAMNGYMVSAVVRETQERCALRMSDGKQLIWYDSEDMVLATRDTKAFNERLESMRKARKASSEELQKARRSHSKKENTKQLETVA